MRAKTKTTALNRMATSTETPQLGEIHCPDVFYTPIEDRFERITRLGQRALGVSVVAVTTITLDTQWFKSVCGWNVSEIPIKDSLCERTIKKRTTMVVPDLSKNLKYANLSLVVGTPSFRFYAGVPLFNVKGTVIGTFCAMDDKPRKFDKSDHQVLCDLAALAQRELFTVAPDNAQTELISTLSVARRQALLDPLTRTWNRRGGMMILEGNLERAARENKSIAVCAVDIKEFKSVNDTFGHAAGDRVLQMVAGELLACVRDSDGVCRFGDDEFFVVIVGATRQHVDNIALRVADNIQQNRVSAQADRGTSISICIGIMFADPGYTATAEDLLAEADKALYKNKMQRRLEFDD